MGRIAFVFALVASAGGVSGSAAAADDPRQVEARKECLAGRTQRGIDLLAELYTETRDDNYIYNQGRCFQQNNRPDEAISRFQEFLRKASDLPPDELADVRRKIAECEQMRAEQRRRDTATAAPAPAPRPLAPEPVREGGNALAEVEPAAGAAGADRPGGSGSALRVVGIVGLAVGLAAVGTGVALGLHAGTVGRDIEQRARDEHTYSRAMNDSGARALTLARISYAVGAVALAGGAVCTFLGLRAGKSEASPSVALVPTLARDGGGGLLHVRF